MNNPPIILCVCCGQVLDAKLQDGGGYFPDRWYIQCENALCDLWMQTATPDNYPFENLESYLAYGRSTRGERILRQLEIDPSRLTAGSFPGDSSASAQGAL